MENPVFSRDTKYASNPYTVGFVLLKNFTMLAFSAAVDTLRMANQLSGQAIYDWTVLTENGEAVCASNGICVTPDDNISKHVNFDVVIIVGGIGITRSYTPTLIKWLEIYKKRKTFIGGICTGAIALAEAGVLDGRRCTVHWEYVALLQEKFPKTLCGYQLYEIDGTVMTSSGGTAPLDMMLHFIRMRNGSRLANGIAEMFVCDIIRDSSERQRLSLNYAPNLIGNDKLLDAITIMESNTEELVDLDDLATYISWSRRQLEREFKQHLGTSPSKFYMQLRLNKARQLLMHTSLSVQDISFACGFSSITHFSTTYRKILGISPKSQRTTESLGIENGITSKSKLPSSSNTRKKRDFHGRVHQDTLMAICPSTRHSTQALDHAKNEPTYGSINCS